MSDIGNFLCHLLKRTGHNNDCMHIIDTECLFVLTVFSAYIVFLLQSIALDSVNVLYNK